MTIRTWIGGGNNQASNPKDWSPAGTPLVGDQLEMPGGTMNLSGDVIGSTDNRLDVTGNATFNMAKNSTLWTIANSGQATFNLSGIEQLYESGRPLTTSAVVNLANNTQWVGGFNGHSVTVTGGTRATFINNQLSSTVGDATTSIDAVVSGTGNFQIGTGGSPILGISTLELKQAEMSNQAFNVLDNARLQLDQPTRFAGQILLANDTNTSDTEIDLNALAKADSYSYASDILNIWSGPNVLAAINFADLSAFGFGMVKTTGGSVDIIALTSSGQTLPGELPIHGT